MKPSYVEQALTLAREIDRRHLEQGADFFTLLRSSNGNLTSERLKSGGRGYYLTRTAKTDGRLLSSTSVFADSDKDAVTYLRGYVTCLAFVGAPKS